MPKQTVKAGDRFRSHRPEVRVSERGANEFDLSFQSEFGELPNKFHEIGTGEAEYDYVSFWWRILRMLALKSDGAHRALVETDLRSVAGVQDALHSLVTIEPEST